METTHEVPRQSPPGRRSLSSWTVVGLLACVALLFGLTRWRAISLMPRTAERAPASVQVWSSLESLKAGRTGPHVQLADVPSGPNVIGIGSLSGLRGEIAIVRGAPWLSYALPDGGVRLGRFGVGDEAATFLAVADVPAWRAQTLEAEIAFDALPAELERRAVQAGLDTGEPIPVLVEGAFSSLELNVVNGPALGERAPTDEHLAEVAIRSALSEANGTLVGFLASRGGERLIHPGKRLHLHVVLPATAHVGHVDSVVVEPGSVLRLPAALD
ncbi:MAG: acetolactate decarboxylase [Myxococcota bacterium]|nr:acetolactate decarboxylase [Myxococcota bacterium]